jgi:hypothetical protein
MYSDLETDDHELMVVSSMPKAASREGAAGSDLVQNR